MSNSHITDAQRTDISQRLTNEPWRVEALEFLLHRRSLDEVTTDEARQYLVIRLRFIKYMRQGELAAEVAAEFKRPMPSLPELYAIHTHNTESPTMTIHQANYFIQWLAGRRSDWSLRRNTTRTINPHKGERK